MWQTCFLWFFILFSCTRQYTELQKLEGPEFAAVVMNDLVVGLHGEAGAQVSRRTLSQSSPVVWPFDAVDISSPYGFRIHPTLQTIKMHRGLDFPRELGSPVTAIADGYVQKIMYDGVYGNVVFLTHEGGWQSIYAHLSEILVFPEERVSVGAVVGLAGSTGRSTGSHLHLGVLVDGRSVDPLYFIGRMQRKNKLSEGPLPFVQMPDSSHFESPAEELYSGD